MKHTMTAIVGCMALVLALFGTASADDATCNNPAITPNPFVVDDGPAGPKAVRVAAGFDCNNIDLQIVTSLNMTTQKVVIEAASILIQPSDPAQPVQMVNDLAGSEIRISAVTGGITVANASIKAHLLLKFTCFANLCPFTATGSDLIVATSFAQPLGAGGTLSWQIKGPINITGSNVHGGDNLEMISSQSSITLICGGSVLPCKDPVVPPFPAIILSQCEDPANPGQLLFPCTATFQNAADLTSVCIAAPFVQCNGGHKEKRFTAFTDINVQNSTIVADEHVTFTCQTGNFFGTGLVLDMDTVRIDCRGTIDISNAKIVTPGNTTIVGGTGATACTDPAAVCINAVGAEITANPIRITAKGGTRLIDACAGTFTTTATAFPVFNSDSTPPYNNTKDTAAECAPEAAGTFCNANGCVQN